MVQIAQINTINATPLNNAGPIQRSLNGVTGSLTRMKSVLSGMLSPLVSGTLLSGLFTSSLIKMALSGAGASNALLRLQSTLDPLRKAVDNVKEGFFRWFLQLGLIEQAIVGVIAFITTLATYTILRTLLPALGKAVLGLGFVQTALVATKATFLALLGPIALVVAAVFASILVFYLLYTRFESFRHAFHELVGEWKKDINEAIESVNLLIRGINALNNFGSKISPFSPNIEANIPEIPTLKLNNAPKVPIVPDFLLSDVIPQQSGAFRQPGQSLFSLTEAERRIIPFIGNNEPETEIDRTGGFFPNTHGTVYNQYFSTTLPDGQFFQQLDDTQLRSRAQGGP